jgi:hypothetical protein
MWYFFCFRTISQEKCAYMFNVYKDQLSRQTGNRNLTGPKTLPTIWYTYMMLVTKYQTTSCLPTLLIFIHIEHICSFFVAFFSATIDGRDLIYDIPALRQTGSRNLIDPKTFPTIWGTYMKLVTKYQISAINSCWEKCDDTSCLPKSGGIIGEH